MVNNTNNTKNTNRPKKPTPDIVDKKNVLLDDPEEEITESEAREDAILDDSDDDEKIDLNESNKVADEIVTVDALRLNMREIPDMTGRVLLILDRGTELVYISEEDGWTEVEYRSGDKGLCGYCKSEFLKRK